LCSKLGSSRSLSKRGKSKKTQSATFDRRQRAIVKIHYFTNAGGGAAALRAHARYLARDGVEKPNDGAQPGSDSNAEHNRAAHLDSAKERGSVFYSPTADAVDGAALCAKWAKTDRRHFRVILTAENGSRLKNLKDFTRAVMKLEFDRETGFRTAILSLPFKILGAQSEAVLGSIQGLVGATGIEPVTPPV
jgi:hypothetical protein